MPPAPRRATNDYLAPEERDIAAQLASYHRKIVQMRAPAMSEGLIAAEETPERKSARRRPMVLHSVAEDYRHARQVQRLLQGVCISQAVLTVLLSALSSSPLLLAYLVGDGLGLAASLARVQRAHGVCGVFNVAYLLSSAGCPLALAAAIAHHGSAEDLVNHIQRRHSYPASVVAFGVLTGIASVLGGILAAYVLARPLMLYRYETVALDEETADTRSMRRGGAEASLSLGPQFGDDDGGASSPGGAAALEPIEAWLSAGEPGIVVSVPHTSHKKKRGTARAGSDLRARLRGFKENLKEVAADAVKQVAEVAYSSASAEELFARAKALNKEGKYKRACELLEEAYLIQPKISTALSAANLRMKVGDHAKAIAAYQQVLALVGTETGPSEREHEMATRKLAEAEAAVREAAINIDPLVRLGEPKPIGWYAAQLDELSDDLFSESATLYAEYGVALQDGLKEISRHLRAARLLACGQVLRPVEKLITKACLSPRDEGEREWLTTVRALLNELRTLSAEVQDALREFGDWRRAGWKAAGESGGLRTEWRAGDDASLWVRIEGELSGAELPHTAAVAHETELWPRWLPFCTAAETLKAVSPTEQITYVQFDLTSMMRRGALIHWSLSDSLVERQSLLLLGASLGDTSPIVPPPSAAGVTIADVRAIKVLIRPRSPTSARLECVCNVDLKATIPQQLLVQVVVKKVLGAIPLQLVREAQRASASAAEAEGVGDALGADNPYARKVAEGGSFYARLDGLLQRYFELFGEGEEGDAPEG